MLRMIGFFAIVLIALQFLRHVPIVGRLFEIPFLGFWGAAILVSAVASKLASATVDRTRFARHKRALGHVDTPHNQGKLGTLLLAAGRARKAIEPLERAVAGEPESVEWRYRLGSALLESGRTADAIAPLADAARMGEEHAYGAVQLRLAEALHRARRFEEVLPVLDRFDKNHGASAESAYRRGLALRALQRRDAARESFRRTAELARNVARYQRRAARGFALRAFLARLV